MEDPTQKVFKDLLQSIFKLFVTFEMDSFIIITTNNNPL